MPKIPKPSKDPGRPIDRPMAPKSNKTNWNKTLTDDQLIKLLKKLDKIKKDKEISKLQRDLPIDVTNKKKGRK